MIKILHLISTTDTGGAEQNLLRLVNGMDRERFHNLVISMTAIGSVGKKILKSGIEVQAIDMTKGVPDPRGILKLAHIIHQRRPHIIQAWMYHANLLALPFCVGRPLIWNIRCCDMDLAQYGPIYRWTFKTGALLSGLPSAIITNSHAGRDFHQTRGYHPLRWQTIANGWDTDTFKPDPAAGRQMRVKLGIPARSPVIGLIARPDPMKDLPTFFAATQHLLHSHPTTHFIVAGSHMCAGHPQIQPHLRDISPPANFHLLEEQDDIPRLLNTLDLATLSSVSEGLPNSIGEAMACGIPCVVTTVGDCARLVGDTGLAVLPSDPPALARAWQNLITAGQEERRRLGDLARRRIREHYSLPAMIRAYENLYAELAAH